jgi:hypothetical protein
MASIMAIPVTRTKFKKIWSASPDARHRVTELPGISAAFSP